MLFVNKRWILQITSKEYSVFFSLFFPSLFGLYSLGVCMCIRMYRVSNKILRWWIILYRCREEQSATALGSAPNKNHNSNDDDNWKGKKIKKKGKKQAKRTWERRKQGSQKRKKNGIQCAWPYLRKKCILGPRTGPTVTIWTSSDTLAGKHAKMNTFRTIRLIGRLI